ncbi:hypothetical protein Tco_1457476 [Tanacetum coccineum]
MMEPTVSPDGSWHQNHVGASFMDIGSLMYLIPSYNPYGIQSFLSEVSASLVIKPGFSFGEISCIQTRNKVACCHFSSYGKLLASVGHEKRVLELEHCEDLKTQSKVVNGGASRRNLLAVKKGEWLHNMQYRKEEGIGSKVFLDAGAELIIDDDIKGGSVKMMEKGKVR